MEDTADDAALTMLLTFKDARIEAAYAAQHLPATCRQTQLLSICVAGYSLWSMVTEDWAASSSFGVWPSAVTAAND
eukprot:CAMPEP_0197671890 /NCGR_PEP_ID=MMETSP1338-20131121/77682_1 /TAXON_ID=43686 ORGANISM="Pelagodinium beii, Strain RCC1491" /NCGR_SAMPLE_ID=MMETSP1338 /ASSEMBLY_ACC=CAM_ASM_000754 /LENGTH=75 /DNA_ID=CAMNT_0043251883 /DNA_START=1 /DNA_END=225 /DNA_ORIENTATION=+